MVDVARMSSSLLQVALIAMRVPSFLLSTEIENTPKPQFRYKYHALL
jgi:hypothetical protein